MTTAEVAAHHGCSEGTVTYWIGRRYLRAVPVGSRCYLVARADCEGFERPRPGRPRGGRGRRSARGRGALTLPRVGLMTVREFAKYHRRAQQTVLRWAAEGRFPVVAVPGGAYLIRRADCEAFRVPKLGAPSWADGATR